MSQIFSSERRAILRRRGVTIRAGFPIIVLLLLVCAVGAWAAEPYAQMWKGEELWKFGGGKFAGNPKHWQGMAGSTIGLKYSGKGPLPEPVEFVIPLEKPLPLGTYRLFVKNFYVGNMEATLGDITHPLRIRRYDWTPGTLFEVNAPVDKIVLRCFPSRIVADTGVKQTQPYIVQGVFLTTASDKVPIRGGEVITSLPDDVPPAKQGNYLANASFECGIFPWGKPYGVSAVYGAANIDSTIAAEGKCSLKIRSGENFGVESPMHRLPAGDYTLSFYAKAEKPVELEASVKGLTEDLKGYVKAGLNKRFTLTSDWKRYSLSGRIKPLPGALYTVQLLGRHQPTAAVWLDGVQLENGGMHDFRQALPREAGCTCEVPGNIFYEGEGSDIDLLVSDNTGAQEAQVDYRVVDYWGQEVDRGTKTVAIEGNRGKLRVPVYAAKRGLFRATFKLDDSTSEFVYSVIPANRHLDDFYPQGSLGVDSGFKPDQLAILKRANFNWVITKMLGRWNEVEPEEGQYRFDPAAIQAADQAKMTVLIQLLRSPTSPPTWIKPYVKPKGGAAWVEHQKYLDKWAAFVRATVENYKGSVHDWEIDNEPNSGSTGAEYGELLKRSSAEIRQLDPKATIAGFSGGGFAQEFYQEAIETAGPGTFDVLSVHFYGNETNRMHAFSELLKQEGKPGWNTETGITCPTLFRSLPNFESLRQKEYWSNIERDMRTFTTHSVQNYLLSRSVAGLERYFYYFQRFANDGPSQPTTWFGNGKELAEFDGSLRANGVGLAIASHFMDEAKYHGPVGLDPRVEMHLFEKEKQSVGFCWSRQELTLVLDVEGANGISFHDIMGNKITGGRVMLSQSPVYFTSNASVADVAKMLDAIKVSSRAEH